MRWTDQLLAFSIWTAVSWALYEDNSPFTLGLEEDSVLLEWKQTYENYSSFIVAIQHANNSIEEINVDRLPDAIPCHLQAVEFYGVDNWATRTLLGTFLNEQTVEFYGVDNWATRTLLGTFLNEQRFGFVGYIHTVRFDNEFIITWEVSSMCHPIRLHVSLNSRNGLIDEQELPAQTEVAKFQYIPQDDQIIVCVTSSHLYDDWEHLTTCTQETPVFRPKMDVKLELATHGNNLMATWTKNSHDIQYLMFLLIKDESLNATDYLPANQTVHAFAHYDPCAYYMAVLYVTTNTGLEYLLDVALYEPGRWFVNVV
ncbi:hypothetical protein AHF37_10821 [Paragonimus kellicotti]|nr:hypothetical protein AHF37_10821 [Paragonimus kellicotti]